MALALAALSLVIVWSEATIVTGPAHDLSPFSLAIRWAARAAGGGSWGMLLHVRVCVPSMPCLTAAALQLHAPRFTALSPWNRTNSGFVLFPFKSALSPPLPKPPRSPSKHPVPPNPARSAVPHEWGVQLLTTLPLAYICVCTYFALFRVTAFDYNKLLPRATTGAALMQNGSLMCRFGPATCWNLLHMIHMVGGRAPGCGPLRIDLSTHGVLQSSPPCPLPQ